MCIEIKLVCVTCKDKFRYRYMRKIARIINLNGCEAFIDDQCPLPLPCS